jgi:hypothetical protein
MSFADVEEKRLNKLNQLISGIIDKISDRLDDPSSTALHNPGVQIHLSELTAHITPKLGRIRGLYLAGHNWHKRYTINTIILIS